MPQQLFAAGLLVLPFDKENDQPSLSLVIITTSSEEQFNEYMGKITATAYPDDIYDEIYMASVSLSPEELQKQIGSNFYVVALLPMSEEEMHCDQFACYLIVGRSEKAAEYAAVKERRKTFASFTHYGIKIRKVPDEILKQVIDPLNPFNFLH